MADSVKGLLIEMKILLPWYSGLVPTHMDLIGDFAGSELFMIEGDSLLRNAFNDTRIEMKASGIYIQLVHKWYTIYAFLLTISSYKFLRWGFSNSACCICCGEVSLGIEEKKMSLSCPVL